MGTATVADCFVYERGNDHWLPVESLPIPLWNLAAATVEGNTAATDADRHGADNGNGNGNADTASNADTHGRARAHAHASIYVVGGRQVSHCLC